MNQKDKKIKLMKKNKQVFSEIFNATRNRIVVNNAIILNSPFSQIIGAMFSSGKKSFVFNLKYLFYPEVIHTMFCPKLDFVFLNQQMRVIAVKHSVPSFSFFLAPRNCKIMIELPARTLKKKNLIEGDKIILKHKPLNYH